MPALLRYHNKFENSRFNQLSLTPSMLDQFQSYADGTGSVRNPLAQYGDNSYENTRGGYVGMVVTSNPNGGTTATLVLTVYEPIMISPFVFGCESNYTSALVDIENMAYTCNFGNLSRVLSIIPNQGSPNILINPVTGISSQLASAALLFEYLTPDPINPIPSSEVSSYFSIVSYPTKTSAPIAPGGFVSITMQSVQVTSIPRRLYIFARDDDTVLDASYSDCFMSLNSAANPLSLTWNNNQFLNQASVCLISGIKLRNLMKNSLNSVELLLLGQYRAKP